MTMIIRLHARNLSATEPKTDWEGNWIDEDPEPVRSGQVEIQHEGKRFVLECADHEPYVRSFWSARSDDFPEHQPWRVLEDPWERGTRYALDAVRGERTSAVGGWSRRDETIYNVLSAKHTTDDIEIQLVLNDEDPSGARFDFQLGDSFLGKYLESIPYTHQHHRAQSLKPHPQSPLSSTLQAKLIELIPYQIEMVRAWVITGPPGTSKTTWASAAVVDMATMYELGFNQDRGGDLLMARIKVPEWIAEIQAYDNRDFDSNMREPDLTPARIQRHRGTVILWLEEIDKFSATETRLQYLYRIIDHVYETQGSIIVTTNATEADLRAKLGDAICRRLFGDNEAEETREKYLHWDLFRMNKAASGKAVTK